MTTATPSAPRWLRLALVLAGVYNLVWGGLVVLLPAWTFRVGGLQRPDVPLTYPEVWQCVGMVVGVYGVGYLIASRDPYRHWPVVLVGLLGKVFGPVGAAWAVFVDGTLPAQMLLTSLTNDLLWWLPFALVLWGAYRARGDEPAAPDLEQALREARTPAGVSLFDLSMGAPVLLVFLRHFG